MSKDADVIVIGGGIIGCSVTYYLSKMGKKVLLLEREDLTAAKVLRSAGATCEEGAVLVFTSGDQAQTAVQALGDYVQKQIDSNRDYRPQELPKLESAVIQQRENTVLLLVAGDLEAAQGVLEQ